jgi:drug/metabolite transporter (DMT)-like permease
MRFPFCPEAGMALHQASGLWRLGLALALVTAACWATLPVALKFTLGQLDVYTLTWFRFLVAAAGLGGWLAWRGALRGYAGLRPRYGWLLALAAATLIGNYVGYLAGLDLTTPATAQLLIQLAPLLMALGGIVVFRERFAAGQWLGLGLLALGLWLFFHDQRQAQAASAGFVRGSLVVVLAAVSWAVYALAQKQLLERLSSPLVLLFVYAVASVALLPLATPARLASLDARHWLALLYCALNTLVAYGAFAEALAHWQASRVSAVLALTPLLTVLCVEAVHALAPGAVAPERIGLVGFAGAALVVLGSALSSLLGARSAAGAAEREDAVQS